MENQLHIGKFVKAILKRKRIKNVDFARDMNYSPTNINALLSRDDWHVKRVMQAEEILNEKILIHFVKLPATENNSMAMEDSPAAIVYKQNGEIARMKKELEQTKEMLELVMDQNKYLKNKLKQYESGEGD